MSKEISIYACGGMSINVVSELESSRNEVVAGFAKVHLNYIDASKSNLINKNLPEESIYTFKDLDGAGKVRSLNYEPIANGVKSILLKFKPAEFNIVVHSCGGGSGSIIGPAIASELKARGQQVIIIAVGSTDTRIEIENTIKTLKTYESIAHTRNSPMVMHYLENSRTLPRQEVNKHVKRAISLLSGLYSGQNAELDTQDLKNWANYCGISGTEPRLASLNFACSPEELGRVGTVISVATLTVGEMETRLEQTPAYQAVGHAPAAWKAGSKGSLQLIGDHPIHYCISDDFISTAVNSLNKSLREIDEVFGSRNARSSIIDRNDNACADGIIL